MVIPFQHSQSCIKLSLFAFNLPSSLSLSCMFMSITAIFKVIFSTCQGSTSCLLLTILVIFQSLTALYFRSRWFVLTPNYLFYKNSLVSATNNAVVVFQINPTFRATVFHKHLKSYQESLFIPILFHSFVNKDIHFNYINYLKNTRN